MDLVLLHAFPLDARMWDVPGALTPSLGGHGEPDLDTLARQVLDHAGDEMILGGCSMGGYVAMAVLRRAPERVKGLVLVDTKHTADTPEAARNRLTMAERVEEEGVGEWLADAMMPNLLSPDASPEAQTLTRTMILEQRPEDVAWWQRAMAKRPDSADVLGGADVPALVIGGELDRLMPPEITKQLADVLPRSTFVEMPGVAHLPPVEQPEQFREVLERWLTSARQ